MEKIYLPTLHTFAMDNSFTGSYGLLRYRVVPTVIKRNAKEVNMEESSITAEYWHGQYCYEKSKMEDKQTFPMSEEGRQAIIDWLTAQI